AFTGIRQGELAALRVKDWNGTHLSIRHSRSRATKRNSNTGEYGELGPAKTNASIRVLEVPPQVAEILNRRARGKRNEDWLFTGPRGGQLAPDHLRTRAWNKACAEVGVEGHTIHDLRDFAASIMIRKHDPPATISRFLGHAHVGVLYQRYAKFFREDDALTATVSGDAFASLDATAAFASRGAMTSIDVGCLARIMPSSSKGSRRRRMERPCQGAGKGPITKSQ